MTIINERSEILFIYQVKDANPNGDPLASNAPRTDPETGVATVTDVRIKRWIRDYWHDRKSLPIWIIEDVKEDNTLKEAFERFQDLIEEAKKDLKKISKEKSAFDDAVEYAKNTWIDIRTFGCVMPTSGDGEKSPTVTLIGPFQISGFNRSYHRVEPMVIQGTGAFAGGQNKYQRTFREDHILPYACIGVYGVINEIAAKETCMTEEDRKLVLEGLWNGCFDLISRSKFGHQPLLLIHIIYKDGYRIGDLAQRVDFIKNVGLEDEKIRNITDFSLNLKKLLSDLEKVKGKITAVEYLFDERLSFQEGITPKQFPNSRPLNI